MATTQRWEPRDRMGAASRERFRVIAEDEFFAEGRPDWSSAPARAPRGHRWTRRVAGAAMAAAVSAVGGAIAVNMAPPAKHLRQRDAPRGGAHLARQAPEVVAQRLLARTELGSRSHRQPRRPRSKGRINKRRQGFVSRRGRIVEHARPSVLLSTGDVRRVAAARAIARPTLAANSSARPSVTRRPEFGFEH